MDNVVVDRSGMLRDGVFFELEVLGFDEVFAEDRSKNAARDVVSLREPTDESLYLKDGTSYVTAVIEDFNGSEKVFDCSLDKTHLTAKYWKDIKIELSGGPHFSSLIVGDLDANFTILVPERLAVQLKARPFRGYRLVKIESVDYSRAKGVSAKTAGFGLYELQFRGRKCLRGFSIVGAPNQCPHCGYKPAVCPECGFRHLECPDCHKDFWVAKKNHEGVGDKRLISAGWDQWRPMIIDVNRWDGADFVFVTLDRGLYSQVITKRVLDWLLSIHAAPFIARPVLARMDGASAEQLEMIDEVSASQSGKSEPKNKKT